MVTSVCGRSAPGEVQGVDLLDEHGLVGGWRDLAGDVVGEHRHADGHVDAAVALDGPLEVALHYVLLVVTQAVRTVHDKNEIGTV